MCRILLISLLFVSVGLSQNNLEYPKPVTGNQYVFPASPDTFWILKHSQYLKAVKNTENLKISDSLLAIYKKKSEYYDEIYRLKNGIIDSLKYGYSHYKDLWKHTDLKLEQAELKAEKRWTFLSVGFIAGVIASAVIINNL